MKKLLIRPSNAEVMMPDLTPFQTEVLCLLIGGNPLPDYGDIPATACLAPHEQTIQGRL